MYGDDPHFFSCVIQSTSERPPKCGYMDKSEKFKDLGIMQAGQQYLQDPWK